MPPKRKTNIPTRTSRQKTPARKTRPPRGVSKDKPRGREPVVARRLGARQAATAALGQGGARLALVPTMGALHDGHIALVRLARKKADRVAVSIFVNPTQFAPTEDLASYPRTFDADLKKLAAEGVDLVWAPDAATMYPEGFATRVAPEGPALAGLEDKFRPHFFGGVATVVTKLFTQVRPDIGVFGEKDYQQLQVIARMATDLDRGVKVIGKPTIRESDGLALSSRNVYLSPDERQTAVVLSQVLKETRTALRDGASLEAVLEAGRTKIAHSGFALDYLEARHAKTLAPIASIADGPVRLLVAARIGRTRLIDNMGV
jgi:pantoate--beta-alanine ligase